MSRFQFWQRWLLIVGIGITVFGVLMAFLSGTPLFDLFNHQIDPAFWGTNPVSDSAREFRQWVYGVWGATIAGWGMFVLFIAHYPFKRQEPWAWNCLIYGLVLWFVLDTALSISYRVWFNVIFNIALLVLALLPVLSTRRDRA